MFADLGVRVRLGDDAGGAGAGHQAAQEATPVRGGGGAAQQADGLLQQGGALLCGEGGHDQLRQTAHPRARREVQPARRDLATGQPSCRTGRF